MNKIVINHYPVEKLPEDMRQGLSVGGTVKVVIEEEPLGSTAVERKKMTARETVEEIERYRKGRTTPLLSEDEAVTRIRQLRDEWDG